MGFSYRALIIQHGSSWQGGQRRRLSSEREFFITDNRVLSEIAWFQQSAWGIHSHLRRADIFPAIRSTKIAMCCDAINQSSHTSILLPVVSVMIFDTMF